MMGPARDPGLRLAWCWRALLPPAAGRCRGPGTGQTGRSSDGPGGDRRRGGGRARGPARRRAAGCGGRRLHTGDLGPLGGDGLCPRRVGSRAAAGRVRPPRAGQRHGDREGRGRDAHAAAGPGDRRRHRDSGVAVTGPGQPHSPPINAPAAAGGRPRPRLGRAVPAARDGVGAAGGPDGPARVGTAVLPTAPRDPALAAAAADPGRGRRAAQRATRRVRAVGAGRPPDRRRRQRGLLRARGRRRRRTRRVVGQRGRRPGARDGSAPRTCGAAATPTGPPAARPGCARHTAAGSTARG